MTDPLVSDPRPSRTRRVRRPRRALVVTAVVLGVVLLAAVAVAVVAPDAYEDAWHAVSEGAAGSESAAAPTESAEATRQPPGSPERAPRERPVTESTVTDAEVLQALGDAFGDDVRGVKVQASLSGDVRIDIQSSYALSPQDASGAVDVAKAAVELPVVVSAYPDGTIAAYVWTEDASAYIVRVTAVYSAGKLDGELNTYVDESVR